MIGSRSRGRFDASEEQVVGGESPCSGHGVADRASPTANPVGGGTRGDGMARRGSGSITRARGSRRCRSPPRRGRGRSQSTQAMFACRSRRAANRCEANTHPAPRHPCRRSLDRARACASTDKRELGGNHEAIARPSRAPARTRSTATPTASFHGRAGSGSWRDPAGRVSNGQAELRDSPTAWVAERGVERPVALACCG
jgi:hypothetical protein